MTLHDDLTRTAALLRAGWPITNLARAKRAQERTMLTADTISQAAVIRHDREAAIYLARAIVRDAERLARTVGEHDGTPPGLSVCVHNDELARAALDLPDAWRNDFMSYDGSGEMVPHTSVTVGSVKFFAAVRL